MGSSSRVCQRAPRQGCNSVSTETEEVIAEEPRRLPAVVTMTLTLCDGCAWRSLIRTVTLASSDCS
jgi:hypothetical protein